jgi:hypothetical protein
VSENKSLFAAVLAVQAQVKPLPKDATNPHFRSKYTPLDTIVDTLRPVLAEHGLVWMTFPCRDDRGEPALRYQLAHAQTGEHIAGTMPLLLTKADPQGMGSALTYARRYSLCAVLNLVGEEDDDGHEATRPAERPYGEVAKPRGASDAQRKRIHAMLKEKGVSRDALAGILEPWDIELGEGWMDRLTPGREGTASRLIDVLQHWGAAAQ